MIHHNFLPQEAENKASQTAEGRSQWILTVSAQIQSLFHALNLFEQDLEAGAEAKE